MSDEKSIEQIAVLLVRAHYDDELRALGVSVDD